MVEEAEGEKGMALQTERAVSDFLDVFENIEGLRHWEKVGRVA